MEFERPALKKWLTRRIGRLIDSSDPAPIAEYVLALASNKKKTKRDMVHGLDQFFGRETDSFVTAMHQALDNKSYLRDDSEAVGTKRPRESNSKPTSSSSSSNGSNSNSITNPLNIGTTSFAINTNPTTRMYSPTSAAYDPEAAMDNRDTKRSRYNNDSNNAWNNSNTSSSGFNPPHRIRGGSGTRSNGGTSSNQGGGRGGSSYNGGGRGGSMRGGIRGNNRGRDKGGASFGGNVGGGSGSYQQRHSDTTLIVSNIPDYLFSMIKLGGHFEMFGTVVKINLEPEKKIAYVQMSTKEEAEIALKSAKSVCNNRFIKVYWAKFDPKEDVTLTSAAELLKDENEKNIYRSGASSSSSSSTTTAGDDNTASSLGSKAAVNIQKLKQGQKLITAKITLANKNIVLLEKKVALNKRLLVKSTEVDAKKQLLSKIKGLLNELIDQHNTLISSKKELADDKVVDEGDNNNNDDDDDETDRSMDNNRSKSDSASSKRRNSDGTLKAAETSKTLIVAPGSDLNIDLLQSHFSSYGHVLDVSEIDDDTSGDASSSPGFSVTFASHDDAAYALSQGNVMDGQELEITLKETHDVIEDVVEDSIED